jgi:hypothetical protein
VVWRQFLARFETRGDITLRHSRGASVPFVLVSELIRLGLSARFGGGSRTSSSPFEAEGSGSTDIGSGLFGEAHSSLVGRREHSKAKKPLRLRLGLALARVISSNAIGQDKTPEWAIKSIPELL